MSDLAAIYNQRYQTDYRDHLTGFEIARWEALQHFLPHVVGISQPERILDYGAGSGLHVALWELLYPEAKLAFCDISSVAREKFGERFPRHASAYHLIDGHHANVPDDAYELVISIEVMEHVGDLRAYVRDVLRVLKPGGWFVWTTPCANEFSLEHILAGLTGQIDPTPEGYRRWHWEDPTHLRRLKTREIEAVLKECGYDEVLFRFRAHLFSFICTYWPPRHHPGPVRDALMPWDYRLFRRLPNGASMIGAARKPF
jgi:SAM-dependent methyltransferase